VKPDYWTDAATTGHVMEEFGTGHLPNERAVIDTPSRRVATGWGGVSVVEKVVGYKEIKFYTHENAGYGDVLPEFTDAHGVLR
jgi:DEAD/DEAH box helicase domain-containing protein